MFSKFHDHAIMAGVAYLLFSGIIHVVMWFTPVTLFMTAKGFEPGLNYVQSRVVGYKLKDCKPVKNSYVGWVLGEEWEEVGFSFPKDLTPDSSKPMTFDKQSFGLWRWYVDPAKDQTLKMTMQHDCGDGEPRTSSFGPFTYRSK